MISEDRPVRDRQRGHVQTGDEGAGEQREQLESMVREQEVFLLKEKRRLTPSAGWGHPAAVLAPACVEAR